MQVPPIVRFLKLRRHNTPRAILFGLAVAAAAIALRLTVRADVGGEQAIFAYPAIVLATLLVGARAGTMAAAVCLAALWYYVIPVKHSFQLADARAGVTLAISILVAGALIWAISAMRRALFRYEELTEQLELRVRERTAERNRFWELSREAVAIVDANGDVVGANPSFRSLIAGNTKSGPFADLIVPEDRPVLDKARASLDGHGQGATFDARVQGAAGVLHIAWSMVGDGGLTYLVGRDYTAEHHCEEQLLQSQKMELVGQISGGLAHDFGNVLSSIHIALHMVRQRSEDQPRVLELVAMAEQSAKLGDALIGRLLAFSRPGESRPETTPLRELLDDVTPLLSQAAGDRMIGFDLPDDLPTVRVDANQFDMALLNLVINARDATGPGDMLTLSVETREDGHVDIVVADDGAGMNAETLSHVAEPFFTTKGPERGTGLGLPMVRNFAQGAGGRFSIDSAPGQGTRARISLPVADEVDAAAVAE